MNYEHIQICQQLDYILNDWNRDEFNRQLDIGFILSSDTLSLKKAQLANNNFKHNLRAVRQSNNFTRSNYSQVGYTSLIFNGNYIYIYAQFSKYYSKENNLPESIYILNDSYQLSHFIQSVYGNYLTSSNKLAQCKGVFKGYRFNDNSELNTDDSARVQAHLRGYYRKKSYNNIFGSDSITYPEYYTF